MEEIKLKNKVCDKNHIAGNRIASITLMRNEDVFALKTNKEGIPLLKYFIPMAVPVCTVNISIQTYKELL